MASNAKVKWFLEADFLQSCNCDYGCPCEFSAPPTEGFCEGVVGYRINRGLYGEVSLDGLGLALIVHWPKAIHEGNGTAIIYCDERADQRQREALINIVSARDGGMPFEILVTTFSKVLEPRFAPIQFEFNGRNASLKVGNQITAHTAPIKNPVTGEPESVRIEHSTGFVFKQAECVSSEECRVSAGEVNFSWPHKAAFVTQIRYQN
jgi:hypothetical protein